jgi:hypothetical protein
MQSNRVTNIKYCELFKGAKVDKVRGFFSDRPKWDPPPPFGSWGGGALARGKGEGGPNSDEGTDTEVYMYFVELGN